ncbi:hypothetical protein FDP41_006956 [Naegleria fowleri]|uniref:RIIa domain-containing protein n=1 Tax=Naegleria fowleri TaxID=5763 RepID=A0A6A5BK85_NAEFO|nr:uncharacterized protein FDP41_006956 [Naegleria fowleri]KAF0974025.1 hypothetical protein FDP41_006956 [Naegleria fowleri]CAG4718660.1 unnamed protein product [Naegleria fowleri]
MNPPPHPHLQSKQQLFLSSLNPVEYLDQTLVTAHLKNAITQILEMKPDDPLEFLSEYFAEAAKDKKKSSTTNIP